MDKAVGGVMTANRSFHPGLWECRVFLTETVRHNIEIANCVEMQQAKVKLEFGKPHNFFYQWEDTHGRFLHQYFHE
jgi:hypothetical protein